MMKQFISLRGVLVELKAQPHVQNYFAGLCNRKNGEQVATTACNVVNTIEYVGFWQQCTNHVHMMEDVLKALCMFNGQEPAMGKAWLTMYNL